MSESKHTDLPAPQIGTRESARDIVQTIALAMQRGYTPDEILAADGPIVERIWSEARKLASASNR